MICDTHTHRLSQVITGYHRLPLDPAVNPSFSRSTPLLSAEFLWISSPKSDYGVSVASGSKHIHSPTHLHISRIKVAQFLPLRTGIQVLVCSSESHQGLGNSVDYGHLNGTWEKHRNGFWMGFFVEIHQAKWCFMVDLCWFLHVFIYHSEFWDISHVKLQKS